MATTKIWAIKDNLSRVVNYAENPNKTTYSELKQVLKYAENEDKTTEENEKTMYVTGINCRRETAYEEMKMTQKRYDKCTGNVAYHAYQSFKTGEVSPELAHKIGVELAEKMWGDYQVLVATHFNTGTYHNHFVINSVNMFNGKKFNCNIGAYYRFRQLSDELCNKYGLTVIERPKGKTPRDIYFAEKRGEPTKYNLMRKAIDEAKEMCINFAQFKKLMYKKGYIINDAPNRKYPTIRSINDKRATRLYHLGDEYLPSNIIKKVERNHWSVQQKYREFMGINKKIKRYKMVKFKGNIKNIKKMSSIDMIFLTMFHLMGLRTSKQKTQIKPVSPEIKETVRKLKRYSNQVILVTTEKLTTKGDVKKYITKTSKDIEKTIELRQKYRNKLRRCKDNMIIVEYKTKICKFTTILEKYRKNLKVANQILEDTPKIKEIVKIEKKMRLQQEKEVNNVKKKDSYMRR